VDKVSEWIDEWREPEVAFELSEFLFFPVRPDNNVARRN
jgi:hypothetical protein